MKLLFSKSSATTKRGCYGTLDFLTSQAFFENVFGKNPHMFAAQPNPNKPFTQVSPDDSLEDSNDSIYFFRFQSNLIVYILDKTILKSTLQPLKLGLKLLHYILSNDTKNVERVESPIISISEKDHF